MDVDSIAEIIPKRWRVDLYSLRLGDNGKFGMIWRCMIWVTYHHSPIGSADAYTASAAFEGAVVKAIEYEKEHKHQRREERPAKITKPDTSRQVRRKNQNVRSVFGRV